MCVCWTAAVFQSYLHRGELPGVMVQFVLKESQSVLCFSHEQTNTTNNIVGIT